MTSPMADNSMIIGEWPILEVIDHLPGRHITEVTFNNLNCLFNPCFHFQILLSLEHTLSMFVCNQIIIHAEFVTRPARQ